MGILYETLNREIAKNIAYYMMNIGTLYGLTMIFHINHSKIGEQRLYIILNTYAYDTLESFSSFFFVSVVVVVQGVKGAINLLCKRVNCFAALHF